MKPDRKLVLLVDFDGVIHSYTSGWKGAHIIPDPPVPGAEQFLVDAMKIFDVQIYSARSCQKGGIRAMRKYVRQHLPHADRTQLTFPTEKPGAFLTLDDRCICFNGTWPDPGEMLKFKPWNKKGV